MIKIEEIWYDDYGFNPQRRSKILFVTKSTSTALSKVKELEENPRVTSELYTCDYEASSLIPEGITEI